MVDTNPEKITNAVRPAIIDWYDDRDASAVYDIKINDNGWARVVRWDGEILHINPREIKSYRRISLRRVRSDDQIRYEIDDDRDVANMVQYRVPARSNPTVVEHENGKYGVEIDE